MNTSKQIVIFSVERSNLSKEENAVNTRVVNRLLKDNDFNFMTCKGVFQGVSEDSFAVILDNYSQVQVLHELSRVYNQDCILYLDANNVGYLYHNNGNVDRIGKSRQVSKDIAMTKDAYTIINNNYYLVD